MKGIMVTPLIIGLILSFISVTPAVVGQTNSSQQSILNGANESSQTNTSRPGTNNQVGPMELVLNDQIIAEFKQKGQLTAAIQPQQYVNGIELLHAGNKNIETITGKIEPVAKENSVLRFELDAYDLQTIKQSGLQYSFDQYERGRYQFVRFDFKTAGTSNSNMSPIANSPAADQNQFGGQSHTHQTAALPAPAPDYTRPYDPQYMGPTRRSWSDTSNTTANESSFQSPTRWSPQPNTGNQLADHDTHNHSHDTHNHNSSAGTGSGNNDFGTPNQFSSPTTNRTNWNSGTGYDNRNDELARTEAALEAARSEKIELARRKSLAQEHENYLERKRLQEMEQANLRRNQELAQPYRNNGNSFDQYLPDRRTAGSRTDTNSWPDNWRGTSNSNNSNYLKNEYGPANSRYPSQNNETNSNQMGYTQADFDSAMEELFGNLTSNQQANSRYSSADLASAKEQLQRLFYQRMADLPRDNSETTRSDLKNMVAQIIQELGIQRESGQNTDSQQQYLDWIANNQSGNNPGGNNPGGNNPGGTRPGGPNQIDDRSSPNNTNGMDRFTAAIAGLQPTQGNAGQPPGKSPFNQQGLTGTSDPGDESGPMYFMLLFSIGLNIYLGWIARGFYVRYNELADELRETFTATL